MPRIHSNKHRALGVAVRETRARRGLSQEDLGFASHLHRNYIGAIERGEINPTFRILLTLTHGLNLPLSELIELTERRYRELQILTGQPPEDDPPLAAPHPPRHGAPPPADRTRNLSTEG